MVDVVFDLNQAITVIQAKLDEPFQVVIDKFIQKNFNRSKFCLLYC